MADQAVVIRVMTSKRLECHVGLHIGLSHIYRRMQEAVMISVLTSGLQLKIKLDQITAAQCCR